MGWVNFVIIKDLKLVVVAPRELRPEEDLQQYVERVLDGKAVTASESDILPLEPYMFEDKPCTDITVVELATLIKVFDSFMTLREVSHIEHLLYWLKKSGISYEILSGSGLSNEKMVAISEEFSDFLLVCLGEDDRMKVIPLQQYFMGDDGGRE